MNTIALTLTDDEADALARAAWTMAETFGREADTPTATPRQQAARQQAAELAARYRAVAEKLNNAGADFTPWS